MVPPVVGLHGIGVSQIANLGSPPPGQHPEYRVSPRSPLLGLPFSCNVAEHGDEVGACRVLQRVIRPQISQGARSILRASRRREREDLEEATSCTYVPTQDAARSAESCGRRALAESGARLTRSGHRPTPTTFDTWLPPTPAPAPAPRPQRTRLARCPALAGGMHPRALGARRPVVLSRHV